MRTSRITAVLGGIAAATLLTVTQASAAGAETERATETNRPNVQWTKCIATHGDNDEYQACFAPEGDWFMISDGVSDGSSGVVDWQVGSRYGAIFNADGASSQRYKNKNFPESATVKFRVCKGHWSTKKITAGTCSGWVSNLA
ncbi:hypothetical protein ACFYVL_31760 [Streptomyces sp. NPDC004111]|uniref:hypothetical protein n=1 Tax=Streptomyces sp. NPDC004111 TaxID=3364690 RepID=UPI00368D5D78